MGKAKVGEVIPAGQRGGGPGNPALYTLNPKWKAKQAILAKQASEQPTGIAPAYSTQASSETEIAPILIKQGAALNRAADYALEAVEYMGRVASGRVRVPATVRLAAARDIAGIAGVSFDRVEAALERQRAAGADANLAPLLAKLLEARALAARKAGAVDVDAAQQPGESGQISGTPTGG